MHPVLSFQTELAEKFKYKPIPVEQSKIYREVYRQTIPSYLKIEGAEDKLYSFGGTLIANGYDRIVIGDYGAFIEFSKDRAIHGAYIIKPGESYRLSEEFSNTKYVWLTTNDCSGIKIYHQKQKVSYADYIPGCFYVSVFEVRKGC